MFRKITDKLLEFADGILNRVTMYRLILYYLSLLLFIALVLSFSGTFSFGPLDIAVSAATIFAACWITNKLFAGIFEAPTNVESVYITALILTLIITPIKLPSLEMFPLFIWASIWAMAAKYILTIKKKHLFNPAAFGVALTALTIGQSASWWAGNRILLPFVILGGVLIVRKIVRTDLALSFLGFALVSISFFGIVNGSGFFSNLSKAFLDSPLLFFAFVMITEPLTTPPTRALRIAYGALVGLLFAPAVHIGSIYSTPELALLAGNVFSYLVSPKKKLVLNVKKKTKIASDTYDFSFSPKERIKFRPGQYMEWTLEHVHPDSRGNRRYFTIASSPTERELLIGVKFYPEASSFKKSLLAMNGRNRIVASQLAGDFTLPRNKNKKLVFLAGGIGITPFRSMIKYLVDKNELRRVTIFYSNKNVDEIAYREILDEAKEKLGIRVVYTLTDIKQIPSGWDGSQGRISPAMIMQEVPDYKRCLFYISGPRAFVVANETMLQDTGIPQNNIKTDFFPGFV